jgi:hypothetical protein
MKRQRDTTLTFPSTFHHFPDLIEEMKGEVMEKMDQVSLFALAQTSHACFQMCRPRVTSPLILETIALAGDMTLFDYIIDCGWTVDADYIYEMFIAVVKRADFPLVQKFEFTWTPGVLKYRDLSACISDREPLYKAIGMSGSADVIRHLTHNCSDYTKVHVLGGVVAGNHVRILQSLGIFCKKKRGDAVARFGECLGASDHRDDEYYVICDALRYGSLMVLRFAFRNGESSKRARRALSEYRVPEIICTANHENPEEVMAFLDTRKCTDITSNEWLNNAFVQGNYKALMYLHMRIGDTIFDTLYNMRKDFYIYLCTGTKKSFEFGMLVLKHTFALWGSTECCCDLFHQICTHQGSEMTLFLDFLHSHQVDWKMQHLEKWSVYAQEGNLLGPLATWFIDHGLRDLVLSDNQWIDVVKDMDLPVILEGLRLGIVPKSIAYELYDMTANFKDALSAWKELEEHGVVYPINSLQTLYSLATKVPRMNLLETLDWVYERDKHIDEYDLAAVLTTLSVAQLHWLDGKMCDTSHPNLILRRMFGLPDTNDIVDRLPFLSQFLGDVSHLRMELLLPDYASWYREHERFVTIVDGLHQHLKIPLTNDCFLSVIQRITRGDFGFYMSFFFRRGLPTMTPEFACSVVKAKLKNERWVRVWLKRRDVGTLVPAAMAAETLKCLLH